MAFPTFLSVVQIDEEISDMIHGVRRGYTAVGAVEGDILLGPLGKVERVEEGSLLGLLAKVERVEGEKTVVEVGQSRAT